jgi:hypothetical protein
MLQVGYIGNIRIHIDDYDEALHEGKVQCPDGHILIAKKGNIREHHFCHRSKENCQSSNGKTGWHIYWQERLRPTAIEFRIKKPEILKIADSVNLLNQNTLSIVEFQNSKMEEEEFRLREAFYTRTDLLSEWGLPYCISTLTWVFNLTDCDIEIDHVFGDVLCFRWVKGTKYMFNAKAPMYWDFGKRELIYIVEISKAKVIESKILGIILPIEDFDAYYFQNALKDNLTEDQKRTNRLPIAEYEKLEPERRNQIIELSKSYYLETKSKTKHKNKNGKELKREIKRLLE